MVEQIYTRLISTEQLAQHLLDPDWRLFDCRFRLTSPETGRTAYQQNHIEGAHYVHLEHDLSSPITPSTGRHPLPDVRLFTTRLANWGVTKQTQVVVYDDSFGSMAARMWWLMHWLGLPAVAVLDGGLAAWNRDKRPLTDSLTPVKSSHINGLTPLDEMWLDHKVVAESLEDNKKILIDARAEARFLGLAEPIDDKAGHIPGAVNIPYEDNLALDGRYLTASALQKVYSQTCQSRSAEDIIVMCGSGVTACHSLLALDLAGLSGAKLYAGSWSEWIRDPQRPVVSE